MLTDETDKPRLLSLLRHAKSDWESGAQSDHQRPLAKRGRRDAPLMGGWLECSGLVPQQVLCSTALRAQQSWALVANELRSPPPSQCNDLLYGASVEEVISLLQQQPDSVRHLLLVGHEPTWSMLASYLMGGGTIRVPTAALVTLQLATPSWRTIGPNGAWLQSLMIPKMIKGCRGR
ncbi:histidine phosphatase family protein [Ectothiorhodospiraceae bacterium BW-2]|nr:histidine phosphatase family protein [Ectothiorhodospiraceae bacterium BW-2]